MPYFPPSLSRSHSRSPGLQTVGISPPHHALIRLPNWADRSKHTEQMPISKSLVIHSCSFSTTVTIPLAKRPLKQSVFMMYKTSMKHETNQRFSVDQINKLISSGFPSDSTWSKGTNFILDLRRTLHLVPFLSIVCISAQVHSWKGSIIHCRKGVD